MSKLLERLSVLTDCIGVGEPRRAVKFTDEPKFSTWVCPYPEGATFSRDRCGGGTAFSDDLAQTKAVAEAVERLALEQAPPDLQVSSFIDTPHAVDPALFLNYAQAVLGEDRDTYIQRLGQAELHWAPALHLNTGTVRLIPAQLVYTSQLINDEPAIRAPISTGAAFGLTRDESFERGLYEVIERDSFMLWWLSREPPHRLIPDSETLRDLVAYYDRYRLDLHFFDITTNLTVPSVLALILDRTTLGPAVSVGLRAASDASAAAIGALLEAQQGREYIRFHCMTEHPAPVTSGHDIVDHESRGLFWYPTQMVDNLAFLFHGDEVSISRRTSADTDIVEAVLRRSIDVYAVALLPAHVQQEGFFVSKMIVPELHPLYLDENYPYHDSARLRAFAKGPLNTLPHPFL